MFYAIGLAIRIIVIVALILAGFWFIFGVGLPVVRDAWCGSFPASCGRTVVTGPGPTTAAPQTTTGSATTGSCASNHVGAGKNLSVAMATGSSVYHFNVAHEGYPAGVEDNFLVSVSTPTSVVLPEGSAWSYSGCSFGDVQSRALRDSAGDVWPTSAPAWLNKPGVSLLTVR